jgi:hypothetical protein
MTVVLFDIIVIALLFVILKTQSEVNILTEFAFSSYSHEITIGINRGIIGGLKQTRKQLVNRDSRCTAIV